MKKGNFCHDMYFSTYSLTLVYNKMDFDSALTGVFFGIDSKMYRGLPLIPEEREGEQDEKQGEDSADRCEAKRKQYCHAQKTVFVVSADLCAAAAMHAGVGSESG